MLSNIRSIAQKIFKALLRFPYGLWLDRLQLPLFLSGVCLLIFTAALVIAYFKLPPYPIIHDALEGGEAWFEQYQQISQLPENEQPIDNKKARSKRYNTAAVSEGYTLISMRYNSPPFIIDMQGRRVHQWNISFKKLWPKPEHISHPVPNRLTFIEGAHLYPNGDLLAIYTGYTDTPWGYGIAKVNKDGKLLWTYDERTHHNVYIDKHNGNIYGLVHHFRPQRELGIPGLNPRVLADSIVLLSKDGKELKRISITEAFRGTQFEAFLFSPPPVGNFSWDMLHTNNVMKLEPEMAEQFPMFKPGQLLISMRNISTIAILDPETQKIVWAKRGPWEYQHAAQFLPNGRILMLDNMGYIAKGKVQSRIIEFDPKTGGITWSYPDNGPVSFLSPIYGHVQRMPNGNTLIGNTFGLTLFEVSPNGKIIWDYQLPKKRQTIDKGLQIKRGKDNEWIHYPRDVLDHRSKYMAPAITYHERFAPEQLPFLANKKLKPKK